MDKKAINIGVAVLGVLIGSGIGYVAYASINPPQVTVETKIVKEEISDEDLEELCASLTEKEKKNVLTVQAEVSSLQAQLAERNAELEQLQTKMKKDASARKKAQKRWKELEEQIALLEVRLAAAEQERDDLKVELQKTLVELDKQVKETKKYKAKAKKYRRESTENLWSAFQSEAKVKGCDRGTRRRHEKCHEAFSLAMDAKMKERFRNCVDTYQAVPVLQQLDKDKTLPNFSAFLDQENRFTKGWFVSFCDPTLPEARDTDLDDGDVQTPQQIDDDLNIDFDSLPE